MPKVRYREEALDDLKRIQRWYLERNPATARAIMRRTRERVGQLETFPELGFRAESRSDRVLTVVGTPLLVIYREAGPELIDIVAVVDGRRDPESRFRS